MPASAFGDEFDRELSDVSVELRRIDRLSDSVGRNLSRAFRAAVLDGKSLRSVLADIGRSFADIALQAAFRPVGTLVSGLVDTLFTSLNPAIPHAKGGVVARPTYFPLGEGLGVAGEAGAEAILPLTRGSDGRLGVAASGGGAGNITINFNVTASDARSFATAEAEISAMLLGAVRRGSRAS